MKRIFLVILGTIVCVSFVNAQDYPITKAWEFLWTEESEEYPWLRAEQGTNWEHDGSNEMDFFSTLIRYDADRLMLLLVENGVNEADPAPEDIAIAEKFPDRSVLWISPVDGSFMGVALKLDFLPAEDTEYYKQKVTGTHPDGPESDRSWQLTEQWPHIAADDDGFLYLVDKHKILRYTPDGDTFTGPEVVFTYPEQDPPIYSTNAGNLHYRAWRIQSINVKGSGNNKVMTTAARFWIDAGGVMYYTSNDGGASWTIQTHRGQEQRGGVGTGGATSAPVTFGEEEWIFANGFPGSDDRLYRFFRTAGTQEDFFQDIPDLWDPQIDPAEDVAEIDKYMKWNLIDAAAADGVPYVAVLSLPKWQSRNDGEFIDATAWVAIHSVALDPNGDGIEGDFLSSYQINVHEIDELQGVAGDEDNWDAASFAAINMYVPEGFPDGAAEILWSGGTSGFGRLVVGDVDVSVKDWSLF
ncbi:MAG: hypothetical protein P9L94_18220 [Candidatus Hinthialibacter antarcticus]|nr:hypothetical protein [Candidatus Hinthialibacter antarcticus]